MSRMESVYISEILFFQEGPGVRSSQYKTEGVKLLNVANFQDGEIDLSNTDRYISEEEAYGKYKHFLVEEGDFVIASSGIKVEYFDKKMGFILKEHLPLCMNTSTIRFKTKDKNRLDINYFMYYLKSEAFKNQLFKQIVGSAQLNFGPSHLRKMKVPLMDIEVQRRVINVLNLLHKLVKIRKNQLLHLDRLVKSQFIEMFGEMDLSRKKKEWTPISCIGTVIGGSTPRTNDDKCWGGDYRWITPAELKQDSGYIYDSVRKITQFGIDSCSLQKIPPNTVLLTSRAPIGKLAIAGNDFYCNQGFKNIICKEEIHPRYLYTLLLHNVNYLNSLGRGATFKEISKEIVENIKIPLPPIELQNKFADFVRQVDKSKYRVYNSRKIINNLIEGIIHLQ